MMDEIAFLYEAAAELRAIAFAAPDIAEELRRMAHDLEDQADELAGSTRSVWEGRRLLNSPKRKLRPSPSC
jgi:hypothetical protein